MDRLRALPSLLAALGGLWWRMLHDAVRPRRARDTARIRIFWSEADDGFIAVHRDYEPGISAFGTTPSEARRELDVALRLVRETYAGEGWLLPDEG